MTKIGIFYGSTGGNTEMVAQNIQEALGVENADLHDVASASADDLQKYDHLILGTSTWGDGDLQDDWDIFISELDKTDLAGKKIALFGLGDQEIYPDTFVDGMGIIYEKVIEKGAAVLGFWHNNGYNFDNSTAVKGESFVGLVIDEDNESEKTDDRVKKWIEQLIKEMDF